MLTERLVRLMYILFILGMFWKCSLAVMHWHAFLAHHGAINRRKLRPPAAEGHGPDVAVSCAKHARDLVRRSMHQSRCVECESSDNLLLAMMEFPKIRSP